jgi:hypothetical protein
MSNEEGRTWLLIQLSVFIVQLRLQDFKQAMVPAVLERVNHENRTRREERFDHDRNVTSAGVVVVPSVL